MKDVEDLLENIWKLDTPILIISLLGSDELKSDGGKAADKKFCQGMEVIILFIV